MKRVEPESLGDVLRQTIRSQAGLEERLLETRACRLWPLVAGPDLASRTSRPSVWKGVMTIHTREAALRSELNMSRSLLRRLINDELGREIIKEIKFL